MQRAPTSYQGNMPLKMKAEISSHLIQHGLCRVAVHGWRWQLSFGKIQSLSVWLNARAVEKWLATLNVKLTSIPGAVDGMLCYVPIKVTFLLN